MFECIQVFIITPLHIVSKQPQFVLPSPNHLKFQISWKYKRKYCIICLIPEERYSELVKCGTVIGTLCKYFNNRHIARAIPKHYQKFMKTYFFQPNRIWR